MRVTCAAGSRLAGTAAALAASAPLAWAGGLLDDFAAPGIDPGRWTQLGQGFTQPGDGRLRYQGSGAAPAAATSR
ncbi:MAG: hypothetical protein ABSH53_07810 [Holophaga sp.]